MPSYFQKICRTAQIVMCVGTLVLAGCASQDVNQATKAAVTPLSDLNLVKEEIPAVLLSAKAHPYALPEDGQCDYLHTHIQELDAVLGPDLDAPASEHRPSLIERGAEEAKGSFIKAIGRTTEGAIPFRNWVRKLSGAERHSRKITAAITAGSIRRAFLKGLWVAKNCS